MSKEKNIWLSIPGFSSYEINRETQEIRSYIRKSVALLKSKAEGKCHNLKADDGTKYAVSTRRILYAAIKGIDPRQIGSYIVAIDNNGELVLTDRNAIYEKVKETITKRKADQDVITDYICSIRLSSLVLEAYRTNDFSAITQEVYNNKRELCAYIKRNCFAKTTEHVTELWEAVAEITITQIVERKTSVLNLIGYLKKTARSLVAQRRKEEARLVSIDSDKFQYKRFQ